ncbi:MAG: hypothetical protein CR986_00190 [Ignavibacteriae bacterium]|nr:MAG: hypothetical protein CR986_00190 [Ignavibacteriota bacterium]
MSFNLLDKYRTKILLPATIILAAIGFVCIYFTLFITPNTNDECIWNKEKIGDSDSTAIVFRAVKKDGVTWNAGIRDGDIFLKIDGRELRHTMHAMYLANRKQAGDSLTYTVSRNGEIFEAKIVVKKLISFFKLAFSLLSLFWLFVGVIVIYSKPYGKAQILFYRIGALSIFASLFTVFGGLTDLNPLYSNVILLIIVDLLYAFGIIFLPFVFVYFFWVFPLERKFLKEKKVEKFIYIIPTIIFLIAVVTRIIFVYSTFPEKRLIGIYYSFFYIFTLLILGISVVTALVALFKSYFKLKTNKEKAPIFIILLTYLIGVLSIIYVVAFASALTESIFNNPEYYLPVFLIVLIPLAFGYSIFRYSLLDVNEVLKNTILYGTTTFLLAGIYFLIIYFLGQTISEALTTEYQGIVAAGIFIIFAVIFQSTKDRFQEMITKYFYPEQFALQKVLIKFSNEIPTIVGLNNILDNVKETFVDELKVEKFGILLQERNSNKLALKRVNRIKNDNIVFFNKGNNITERIIGKNKLHQPAAFDQLEFKDVFPCAYENLIEEKIHTAVPLVIKGKLIGMLLFGLKYSGAQFSGKDIELLIASANQIATSIENARLYEEETKKIKLERDLDVAREIQEGLLPKIIPQVHNLDIAGTMIPAMQVGGDYYDLIKISDTQMFVVVGDVSGKGLSASFYMSKLQTMIRLFSKETKSPRELLIKVNKNLIGNIDKKNFITLVVAFIDIGKRTIKICRAGHPPVIKISGRIINQLKPKGIGIGLEFGEIFNNSLKEIELTILPKDIFILSSDGVNEAMNENKEFYGNNILTQTIIENSNESANDLVNTVINSIKKFRGSVEPNDDITLVIVKVL